MRWRFWKRKPVEVPAPPKPESHKRVMTWADRFNASVTSYEELRVQVVADIDDKREELRQIDIVLAALKAGLHTMVDDTSLPFMISQSARSHLDELPSSVSNELDLADFTENGYDLKRS